MNCTLYIGNLPPGVSEEDLRQLFSKAGSVTEVKLVLDPSTHQSRGVAFVSMATPEQAAAAMGDFHCYSLGGRNITVTEARPPQPPTGRIGEGFGPQPANPFKPGAQRRRTQRRSGRRGDRQGQGR